MGGATAATSTPATVSIKQASAAGGDGVTANVTANAHADTLTDLFKSLNVGVGPVGAAGVHADTLNDVLESLDVGVGSVGAAGVQSVSAAGGASVSAAGRDSVGTTTEHGQAAAAACLVPSSVNIKDKGGRWYTVTAGTQVGVFTNW